MTKQPAKNKGGRPSKFKGLDIEKVRVVARKGWTDVEMASFFGVAESTWYKWKVDYPEFSEALRDWKHEADERVERSLYERACGYSHPEAKIFNNGGTEMVVDTIKHYPPDTTAAIYWLKNRQPDVWRDKTEVDQKNTGEMKIEIVRFGQDTE